MTVIRNHPLPIGTRVFDAHDPRHVGRIDASFWSGATYRVTFDNGTRADIPRRRVQIADDD